jgi:hypothetical protein
MMVNREWLWILFIVCCVPSVAWFVRRRLRIGYYRRHEHWRQAPRAFVWTLFDATMLGLGIGLCIATAVLALAVLRAHLR